MNIKQQTIKLWYFVLIILIIITLPTIIYFFKFHSGLSSDFNKWSAFGSYIGGVYGPLLSFLSLLILAWTLFQMKSSQKQDREQFTLQINEQKRQQNIDDIIMLTKMIRDAFGNNPLVENIKLYPSAFKKEIHLACYNRQYNDPVSTIADIWDVAYTIMKKDRYFDSEVHILGEVLKRLFKLSNIEDQKTAKVILKGLIPQDQRFLLKCYAAAHHPQAQKYIARWPDFCHTPPEFESNLKSWGKKP